MMQEGWAERPVVLFDFDGTVADTAPGVLRIARLALERAGKAVPDERTMLLMVGPPLEEGFRLVGARDAAEAAALTADYRVLFDELLTVDDYPVFPGMRALLAGLRAQGRRLAIATSRMEDTATRMVGELGLLDTFEAVCGRVPGVRYSKAESIAAALGALGAAPSEALMVGDRHHDVEGARELGIPCIGIYSGGARAGEHEAAGAVAAAHDVSELAALLGCPTDSAAVR